MARAATKALSERDFIAAISDRPDIRLFLIHGQDESAAADIAVQMAKRLGQDVERIDIDSDRLRSDPALLADEACSLSLFGGARYIRLNMRREEGVDAIENLLAQDQSGCPVIAIAGNLPKTSKLRKLAESAPKALAFICYAANAGDAVAAITALGSTLGLRLDRSLAARIARYTGNDRKLAAIEVEKLALYHDASPEKPVAATPQSLEALSAETGEENVSELVNQIMGGNIRKFGHEILISRQMGVDAIRITRALQRRAAVLSSLRAKVDDGASPDAVVRATPSIFFMDRTAITDQLGRWTSAKLAGLGGHLIEIERQLMTVKPELGTALLGQELSRIARMAARAR